MFMWQIEIGAHQDLELLANSNYNSCNYV